MKITVLGSSGAEFPNCNPPAILMDETLLLDAGTIGAVLTEDEQWKIRHILLTHAHLDHIKGIPFLADNLVVKNKNHQVTVQSIAPVLKVLKENLLNNLVWPDFTAIPTPESGVLRLIPITQGTPFKLDGYEIIARDVPHSVQAVGYVIKDSAGRRLLYTGDTGPTEDIWTEMDQTVHCAIIEVSFPNSMQDMAIMTGHLTAELLRQEIGKMKILPEKIFVTHPKPQYLSQIKEQVSAIGLNNIEILKEGASYTV